MKTQTKLTWTGDVATALAAVGTKCYSNIFNDKHKTCRRLKFAVRELTDEQLTKIQEVLQERRPKHTVTVSRWNYGYWNTVVYYRSKTSVLYKD